MKESPANIDKLYSDISQIIESGMKVAYAAVERSSIFTKWNVGKRIVEEEQHGEQRAQYGKELIKLLADKLTTKYGGGYGARSLAYYRQFYLCFNDIEILHTRVQNLTWSHFKIIMREATPEGRAWYLKTAAEENWGVRTLERNVTTQYYGRMMASQRNNLGLPSPAKEHEDPLEYLKNPFVGEFMGFKRDATFTETQLEQALIDNLQSFMLELGRGFAFVDRQKHIATDTGNFYIDLVFYNFRMKRFVLIELKTHKLTHQDVGQLDMYVRMYDDLYKGEDDNPTIGILLCTDTDNTIARYSVLHDSDQLFASKYMAYMPTEEELRLEIEQQKRFFLEQHGQ